MLAVLFLLETPREESFSLPVSAINGYLSFPLTSKYIIPFCASIIILPSLLSPASFLWEPWDYIRSTQKIQSNIFPSQDP